MWCKASELRPKDGQEVIVRVKNGDYHLATFNDEKSQFNLKNGSAHPITERELYWKELG